MWTTLSTYRTYGSENIPGVSSWDEVQPAPPPPSRPPKLLVWGQSASNPSHTPKQVLSLQSGSFPTVSDADTGRTPCNDASIVAPAKIPKHPCNIVRRPLQQLSLSQELLFENLIVDEKPTDGRDANPFGSFWGTSANEDWNLWIVKTATNSNSCCRAKWQQRNW